MTALRRGLSLTVMPASLAAAIAAALLGMQAGAPPASLVPPIFIAAIVLPRRSSACSRTGASGIGRAAICSPMQPICR